MLQQQLGVLAHQQLDAADDRRAGEMEDTDGAGRHRASGHGKRRAPAAPGALRARGPLLERLDRLGLGIGETVDRPGVREAHGDDPPRHADDRRVGRHVGDDDRAGPDPRALADVDGADQLGVRADDDAIVEGRVALLVEPAGAAEGDALVEHDVVADLGRLADDDAHAVIDEQPFADPAAGWISTPVTARLTCETTRASRCN